MRETNTEEWRIERCREGGETKGSGGMKNEHQKKRERDGGVRNVFTRRVFFFFDFIAFICWFPAVRHEKQRGALERVGTRTQAYHLLSPPLVPMHSVDLECSAGHFLSFFHVAASLFSTA